MPAATRELYVSSSGDRWELVRAPDSGHPFIRHTANEPSGGNVVEVGLGLFLTLGDGPEQQELWRLIETLVDQGH